MDRRIATLVGLLLLLSGLILLPVGILASSSWVEISLGTANSIVGVLTLIVVLKGSLG